MNRLDEAGFAVMRAPASGSATERELPDALAGNDGAFYALEAKASAGDPIYLTGEEVDALGFFATNFGARSRVAVRFDREDWYFFAPDELYVTDGGNYRVKKETALDSGQPFEALVAEAEALAEEHNAGRLSHTDDVATLARGDAGGRDD